MAKMTINNQTQLFLIALILCGCWHLYSPSVCAQELLKDSKFYEKQALNAYKAKDFAAFLENMQRAESLRPNHPRLLYNLAAAYALRARATEAIATLEKLARMKLVYPAADDEDFASLRETAEFRAVVKSFEANAAPLVRSTIGFTVAEKGLVPESVAFDPQTSAFYLGSVAQRKIFSINKNGEVKVFADESNGLWSVLGMKVDAKRRLLWASVSALPETPGLKPDEEGSAALFKFDLQSGKLVKKYLLPNAGKKHVLGDLTIKANGDVYATDSVSPAIYAVRRKKDEIEKFLEDESFASLQGLDFSADESFMFVADYSKGVFKINLKTKKTTLIAPAQDSTLLGIDGLYFYQNSLIGVQNGVNPQRIVRLYLSKEAEKIERVEILEANNPLFDEPTLGLIISDEFYFVANSQWNQLGAVGQLKTPEKLKNAEVLKIKL